MHPTPTEVIDAITFSLREDIAGELQSGWAKRILSSTLNALDYLKLRWEHDLDILVDDNADLGETLEKIDRLMDRYPAKLNTTSFTQRLNRTICTDTKPSVAIKKMEEQNRSMRQSLVGIMEQLDDCGDPEIATQIRRIVHPYIQRQLVRESKLLLCS